jgi:hypothetical protein
MDGSPVSVDGLSASACSSSDVSRADAWLPPDNILSSEDVSISISKIVEMISGSYSIPTLSGFHKKLRLFGPRREGLMHHPLWLEWCCGMVLAPVVCYQSYEWLGSVAASHSPVLCSPVLRILTSRCTDMGEGISGYELPVQGGVHMRGGGLCTVTFRRRSWGRGCDATISEGKEG